MITINSSLDKVLENAFQIKRKGTKHRGEFSYNSFQRPITHLCFFQLLHNSGIDLSSFKCQEYMCHIKATDYVTNWRGGVKLEITSSSAWIVVEKAPWLNIILDRGAVIDMFSWFKDQSLFHTDFGELVNSENYYH